MRDKIILKHGYISIPDYELGDNTNFENMLSLYDDVYHRMIPIGYSYNEKTKELRVPAGLGINKCAKMLRREPDVDYAADPERKAIINLSKEPRSLLQRHLISYLAGEGKFHCNAKYSQICVVAGTGEGKTYCAIAALSFLRTATMIITDSAKLRKQWKTKLLDYTNLSESDVMILDSSSKIDRLFKSPRAIRYKAFTVTHSAIDSYANKYSWDKVGEFFAAMGIGCTIIDEVHKCFANTVRILTHINSKKIFILTATFKRSEYRQNAIFQSCFATIPKYIQDERESDNESQKHINGIMVLYDSKPSLAVEMSCEGRKGFDKYKYADYLVEQDKNFFDVFGTYLTYFSNTCNTKTMIFCGSINACESIANYASNVCKGKLIAVYHSKVKKTQAEKDDLIDRADIIVTTSASLGTGADISGIHCIINLESYRSDVATVQNPGRLRKEPGETKPYYYIEIVNIGFRKVFSQFKTRKKVFKKNFGRIKVFDKTK